VIKVLDHNSHTRNQMDVPMNELTQIEKELTELHKRLERSFGILDSLADIQQQFEQLSQTHQKFKDYLENTNHSEAIPQLQERFNQRFADLESATELTWKELRRELVNLQNQIDSANRNLGDKVTQQVNNAKNEIDQKSALVNQEWMNQREAMQRSMRDFENRFKNELRDALTQLSEQGFNPTNLQKLDDLGERVGQLNTQMRKVRPSVSDMEKQVGLLRNGLIVSIVVAATSLVVSGALIFSRSNSAAANDSEQSLVISEEVINKTV
jgi:DNA polymerase III alpha subunit (gram-positive type)